LKKRSKLLILLIVISVIFLDQVSKYFADLINAISCNKGIAFGFELSSFLKSDVNIVSAFFSVIVILYFLYLVIVEKNLVLRFSFSLIMAGGVSNLIDRLLNGCVRDFVSILFFPSFNLADVIITVGVFILIYEMILRKLLFKSSKRIPTNDK